MTVQKPLVIVVTGSPASGKSTLTHILSGKINCPFLSRDKLKEGILTTLNESHGQLDSSVDLEVNEIFFETTELLVSKKMSLIIEAAFQDKLWRPKLVPLMSKAEIKIIICHTNFELIKTRFINRFSENPDRDKFHGDKSIALFGESFLSMTKNYQPINIDVPTLCVDTTENYQPSIEDIIQFISR